MVCPSATGPCTLAAEGSCIQPKSLDTDLVINDLMYEDGETNFTVSWDSSGSDPNERVKIVYRESVGIVDRRSVLRSAGTANISSLPAESFFRVWVRLENATHYGVWSELHTKTYPVNSVDFRHAENSQYVPLL